MIDIEKTKVELNYLKSLVLQDEFKRKMQKIQRARKFCNYLEENNINYNICIKHKEVLGCSDSENYYRRFLDYLGDEYVICKNLLIQERKGDKRKFLLIIDSKKQLDFKELREVLDCRKLEFVSDNDLKELLDTTPGNISLFNIMYDSSNQVNLIIDKDLLDARLLAFHPLYNGMSIFLEPLECFKFLELINKSAEVVSLAANGEKQFVKKSIAI